MIVLGSLNLQNCPASPSIPIILMGIGLLAMLIIIFDLYGTYCSNAENEGTIRYGRIQLFFVLSIWSLAGCFSVYRIYLPTYDDHNSKNYCDKITYLCVFWFSNTFTGILAIILLIVFCYCCKKSIDNRQSDESQRLIV